MQTANRETGANCKNVSLHRGKAIVKQRFQTGAVDEVCFLGMQSGHLSDLPSALCMLSTGHDVHPLL